MMEERLRLRVAELGWKGSLRNAAINIAWQYLIGSFDPKVVQPFVGENGSRRTRECEDGGVDLVWASVTAMLDEAERVGRTDDLAPPSIKTPEQIIELLGRRFGRKG